MFYNLRLLTSESYDAGNDDVGIAVDEDLVCIVSSQKMKLKII